MRMNKDMEKWKPVTKGEKGGDGEQYANSEGSWFLESADGISFGTTSEDGQRRIFGTNGTVAFRMSIVARLSTPWTHVAPQYRTRENSFSIAQCVTEIEVRRFPISTTETAQRTRSRHRAVIRVPFQLLLTINTLISITSSSFSTLTKYTAIFV